MNHTRGSIWRKWDLHLHTPATTLNNQYEGTSEDDKWERYIGRIEESGLSVIGATNYFCIKGYDKLRELKDEGRMPEIKAIFPNVEFRMEQPNQQGVYINVHVLFSNLPEVVNRIPQTLARVKLLSTTTVRTALYCTYDDLDTVGFENCLVTFTELLKVLKSDFKQGEDYLVISPCRGHGSYRPGPASQGEGRGATLAKEIDKNSNMIYGRDSDREYFLNAERFEGAIPKPVLWASDAHSLDAIGEKFTWIKAEPTFEGLKQIIYEPDLRVRVQVENPAETEAYSKIGVATIRLPDDTKIKDEKGNVAKFCFGGRHEIAFSNNLTCLIGGRGTGKSTLVQMIYNASGQDSKGS